MTEPPICAANSGGVGGGGDMEERMCMCVCVSVCLIVCVHRAMDVPRVAERRRCKEDRQRDRWAGGGNMRDGEGNWKIGSRDEI